MTIQDVIDGTTQWAVIHGDCLEVMAGMSAGAADHVLTDPPFTQRTTNNARTNDRWRPQSEARSFIDFGGITPADYVGELLRAASRWVLAFCALEQLGEYAAASGDRWVRAGIWAKPDGAPQFTGDRPAQGAEGIAIMHAPGRKRWNGGGGRGLWAFSVVQGRAEFEHPTPKPIDLMVHLVELFTDPGDLVLDPFCGSATTGVACLRLGRRFVGIEKDPKYFKVAMDRMKAESQGLSLKDARAGQLPMFGA